MKLIRAEREPCLLSPFSSCGFVGVNETDAQLYVLAEENCEREGERECVGGKARVAFHNVDSPASCTAEYMAEQKRERVGEREFVDENWKIGGKPEVSSSLM